MALVRRPSPTAQRYRRPISTVWGVLLLSVWLVVSALSGAGGLTPLLHAQAWVGAVLVGGALLLGHGLRAAAVARSFERADSALADALEDALTHLYRTEAAAAYRSDVRRGDGVELAHASLMDAERHFDEQHVRGVATGASTSVATTRTTPMGDAVFALVQASGPAGPGDIFRVVSLSTDAASGWVRDTVVGAARRFGGPDSHAGATLLRWSGPLAAHFGPPDICYADDRLTAACRRPPVEREPVTVRGRLISRNAVLATQLQLGQEPPLLLTPASFAELLDDAVTHAAEVAQAGLNPTDRKVIASAAQPASTSRPTRTPPVA